MISRGLIAGLTLQETLDAEPGFVLDLYLLKRRYDDEQHMITRRSEYAREPGDGINGEEQQLRN